MPDTTRRRLDAIRLLLLAACTLPVMVSAQTLTLQATADFPVIDAGLVPYYSEAPNRNSLAINAANVDYRDKFARATTVYDGESGFFDITLSTLAELDGEAEYRVLVNDVLAGTATNPEVTVDYTLVKHTFNEIVIPAGATIAVESLANTNGRIPEGDGTAYARGRWTSLELIALDPATVNADEVDLSVSVSTSSSSVVTGDTFDLDIAISSAADSAVATNPILTVTVPSAEIGAVDIGNCTQTRNTITCNLAELAAGDSTQLTMTLEGLSATPSALIQTVISADQDDSQPQNNTVLSPMIIGELSVSIDTSGSTDTESGSGNSSGGGKVSWLVLMALAGLRGHRSREIRQETRRETRREI